MTNANFLDLRREAERLWRIVADASGDQLLGPSRERLAELAGKHDAVEAGRQHAICRAGAIPARAAAPDTAAAVIRVGPTRKYRRPSEAAAVAVDGSVVEIDAAVYEAHGAGAVSV